MQPILRIRLAAAFLAGALQFGSLPPDAAAQSASGDLSRLVVLGDSLSAGYQNDSLFMDQQVNGFASLVARQAGVPLTLPLIGPPGIPAPLVLTPEGDIVRSSEGSGVRVNPLEQATNLAVPGHNVGEALREAPDCDFADLTDVILGLPGCLVGVRLSQIQWAEALAPTTVLVWLGSNDSLRAITGGDASLATPVAEFTADFQEVMRRLAAPGRALIVANVPEVTVIPFLVPAAQVAAEVAAETGLPAEVVAAILALAGLGPDDFLTLRGFAALPAALAGTPFPHTAVITAGELAAISLVNEAHNAVVEAEARARGAALVDIRGILRRAQTEGVVVGGQRLTTVFLGGLFSLDGIHPTNTGHAIVANAFIKALDRAFGNDVPPLAVREVQRDDPLVLPGVGHPPAALERLSPEAAEGLAEALD